MTILHTLASARADHGGTSRSVPALTAALGQRSGNHVHLVTAAPDTMGRENVLLPDAKFVASHIVREQGILGRLLRAPVSFYQTLKQVAAETSPDVIHDHGAWLPSNWAAVRTACREGVPLVVSPRGMVTSWSLSFNRRKKQVAWHLYQKRLFEQATLFHVTAPAEAKDLRALGFDQPVAVIPNAVTPPSSMPHPPKKNGGTGRRRALFLSRLHPKKGLPVLLDAWAEVQPEGWILELVGPDANGYRDRLERRTTRLGIDDLVTFSGSVNDAEKWKKYVAADLFVLPSHSENFGIVVAEALAAGVPVITTTGTPWKEIETHDCGWWIDLDIDTLADTLADATTASPDRRRAMGRRGRKLVEEHYSWSHVAKQMEQTYNWLLNGGSQPDCIRTT